MSFDTRLKLGEAWMWCQDCGAKLFSFDGYADGQRPCPERNKCNDRRPSPPPSLPKEGGEA